MEHPADADRTNISVAILAMAADQGWDDEQQGYVLSAFFYGYMVTQIPGGMYDHADRCSILAGCAYYRQMGMCDQVYRLP